MQRTINKTHLDGLPIVLNFYVAVYCIYTAAGLLQAFLYCLKSECFCLNKYKVFVWCTSAVVLLLSFHKKV